MNSGELNKIAGAVIGALLLFLLLGFFSELFYRGSGGHGEGEVLAYAVEIEDTGSGGAEEETIDLAALVAEADPARGEKAFKQCAACHKLEDGANATGPYLWGVVGREIGSVAGYSYSDAMANHGGTWDLESLFHFLESPKGFVPGTKMAYNGMKKPQDRVDLIAYLNEADGSPIELAAAPAETATDAAPAEGAEAGQAAEGEQPAEAAPAEGQAATDEQPAQTEETGTSDQAAATETETAAAQPAAGGATEAAAAGSSLYASASAEDGEKVFRKCKACHTVEDGKNRVGPHLHGVVGRAVAGVEGYSYSDAMANHGGTWDAATLDAFLANPKGEVPGTKMAFGGIKDEADRAALIVYLNEADGSPEPLP